MKKRIVILLMIVLLASCAVSAAADEELPVSYEPVTFYLFNMEIPQSPDSLMENIILEESEKKEISLFCSHYMRNGRCVKCGFIEYLELPEDEKNYYNILLYSIESGKNPMKNDEFVRVLRNRFESEGMTGKYAWEANAIIEMLYNADELYRNLYLLSVFNYNAEVNTKGVAEYNVLTNRFEVSTDCAFNDDKFLSTYFHESGHGIELNLWEPGNMLQYTSTNAILDFCEKNIKEAVNQDAETLIRRAIDNYLRKNNLSIELPEDDIDAIVKSVISDNTQKYRYTGKRGSGTLESADSSCSLAELFEEVVSSINGDLCREIQTNRNISKNFNGLMMADDVMGGVTNNKINYNTAHSKPFYWWMFGEQTHMIVKEAWAGFFAAKLLKNEDCIEVNEIFFPKATQELEDFANELYDYYLDYYTDVMERQNQ